MVNQWTGNRWANRVGNRVLWWEFNGRFYSMNSGKVLRCSQGATQVSKQWRCRRFLFSASWTQSIRGRGGDVIGGFCKWFRVLEWLCRFASDGERPLANDRRCFPAVLARIQMQFTAVYQSMQSAAVSRRRLFVCRAGLVVQRIRASPHKSSIRLTAVDGEIVILNYNWKQISATLLNQTPLSAKISGLLRGDLTCKLEL